MQFPFVSRDTLNQAVTERDARIAELTAERKALEERVWLLTNQIAYRHSGLPLDPSLKLRPEVATVADPPKPKSDEIPTQVEQAQKTAGRSVRGALQLITDQNQMEYQQAQLKVARMKPAEQEAVSEAAELLSKDISEGKAAAQ